MTLCEPAGKCRGDGTTSLFPHLYPNTADKLHNSELPGAVHRHYGRLWRGFFLHGAAPRMAHVFEMNPQYFGHTIPSTRKCTAHRPRQKNTSRNRPDHGEKYPTRVIRSTRRSGAGRVFITVHSYITIHCFGPHHPKAPHLEPLHRNPCRCPPKCCTPDNVVTRK